MRVSEIFRSISGEVGIIPQGEWAVFVRVAGCNLGCPNCDTKYASRPGAEFKEETPEVICQTVSSILHDTDSLHVLLTGGEPLIQPELPELLELLHERGAMISIETNGSILPETIRNWEKVRCWIADYKLPDASGEEAHEQMVEYFPGIKSTLARIYMKMVIGSHPDFRLACETVKGMRLTRPHTVYAFSPCAGAVEPADLFRWMRDEWRQEWGRTPILNIQIHRLLGGGREV